jgi:hypothetical protein
LSDIIDAILSDDIKLFEKSLRNFDSITPLKDNHIMLLTKIKENISDDGNSLC